MTAPPNLDVSDAELADLGSTLGGCDFTGVEQRRFLESTCDCDVQAAPGSGKTTLLVAKLAVVSRRWMGRTDGVCVLSHTNAARLEVERRLLGREAATLLAYPHFIGTLTAFVDRFLCLPLLRGIGWPVRRIDDAIHESRAKAALVRKDFLWNQFRKREQFSRWAAELTLAPDFQFGDRTPPIRIRVDAPNMPGPNTETRKAFEEIKADLLRDGIYRYADMLAVAERALAECPALAVRLAARFPLVLVDEAQDSSPRHLALLRRVFRGRSVVQYVGDCNQTIFNDGASEGEGAWTPGHETIDLGESRRFGPPIASFASRLTVRKRQDIRGGRNHDDSPCLITFTPGAAASVLPVFARVVAGAWPAEMPDAWAIASVHRPGDGGTSTSLRDFFSAYRAPSTRGEHADTLHAAVRSAAIAASSGGGLKEHVGAMAGAVVELLRRQGVVTRELTVPRERLWQFLDDHRPGGATALRQVVRSCILGDRGVGIADWPSTCDAFLSALAPLLDPNALTDRARQYRQSLDAAEAENAQGDGRDPSAAVIDVGGRAIRIRLGSVASVKGQTHDATLVLQTTSRRVPDVKTAFDIATGARPRPTEASPVILKAATNVFVGATRPRRLLCIAMPEADVSASLRSAVEEWGWRVLSAPTG